MASWYRGFIQGKTRVFLAWAFVVLLFFLTRQYPSWPGIILCFLGATLRFWASGYLRKDQNPAVGGPYSFVRNPLYLGTYLMAVGVSWAIHHPMLLLFVTLFFAAVYHFIILDEESKLQKMFGESYVKYCEAVPRFFPRLWPAHSKLLVSINPEHLHQRYSWKIAIKNKAYEAYAAFIGLVILLLISAFLWSRLR